MEDIKVLEEQLQRSKNTIEQAKLADKIRSLKAELNKPEDMVKEMVPTRNATPVADHKASRRRVRGEVMISDEQVFIS